MCIKTGRCSPGAEERQGKGMRTDLIDDIKGDALLGRLIFMAGVRAV